MSNQRLQPTIINNRLYRTAGTDGTGTDGTGTDGTGTDGTGTDGTGTDGTGTDAQLVKCIANTMHCDK